MTEFNWGILFLLSLGFLYVVKLLDDIKNHLGNIKFLLEHLNNKSN